MVKTILFICKWNRFRSQFSEKYFNKINSNKKFRAKSVGMIRLNRPLTKDERDRNQWIKNKYGLRLGKISKGINFKDLEEAYRIIVVADDVPVDFLKNGKWKDKLIIWKIKDVAVFDKKNIDKMIAEMKKKVDNLIKNLR